MLTKPTAYHQTLGKLEREGLLRPNAGDHIRTIVAKDIAGRCDERYRL